MLRNCKTPKRIATQRSRSTAKRLVKLGPSLNKLGSSKSPIYGTSRILESSTPSTKFLRRNFHTSTLKYSPPTEQDLRVLVESLQKSQTSLNTRVDVLQTDINKLVAQLSQQTYSTNQLIKTNNGEKVNVPEVKIIDDKQKWITIENIVICVFIVSLVWAITY